MRTSQFARRQMEALADGLKFLFSGTGGWGAGGSLFPWGGLGPFLPGAQFDYRREAGNLWENSAVAACIYFLWRTYSQAEPYVERRIKGLWQKVDDHPLPDLLAHPNPYYDGTVLAAAIITSLYCDG
ncbi:MAG: hypothetical protein KGL39_44805, partial [Patescibacteria group bacterium]|nr:hypothetical protein [Patescibacteria group bacterium]